MRLPIRYKIILPFALLLVLVGVIGNGVATAQLTNAAVVPFDANLLHGSLVANQLLSQVDAARLADLRLATNTIGVPESLATGDVTALTRLLTPVAGNEPLASFELRVLDSHGRELLSIRGSRSGPSALPIPDANEFAAEPAVIDALAGGAADHPVFLYGHPTPSVLYWTGSVRAANGRVVGAVLAGESLTEILGSIQGSALYDVSGGLLATTVPDAPILSAAVRSKVRVDNTVRVDDVLAGHNYRTLFSTWTTRGSQLGFLAVQARADALVNSVNQVRLILTLLFTAAGLLTLLVGMATASLLTRPVDLLVRSMRTVSEGDLQHRARVASNDEIGYLARTFNEMTASLEQKTAALEETTFASMEALARTIDARDPSTFGHSSRVAAISAEIAAAMPLTDKEREALRRAALLHDIGKIGIEDKVLRKPGPLNAVEADDMREHPRIGFDMLKGLPFLKASLPGILYHHERWDGAGYPTGLRGTAIPLPVRILAVADVFDALTSDRPYREGLSFDAATAAIRMEAGLQFDPDVVTAFLSRRASIEAALRKMGKTGTAVAAPEAA
jgi:putative nucleotidyltransferase with HDIG domain